MATVSDRRLITRWVFRGAGLVLLLGAPFVLQFLTNIDQQAAVFFPEDIPGQMRFHAIGYLLAGISGLLCLLTSRGLRLGRNWARWTGMLASSMVLPLFPLLSLAGVVGVLMLGLQWPAVVPAKEEVVKPAVKSTDYWTAKRNSFAQRTVAGVLGVAGLLSLSLVDRYAAFLGMPAWTPGIWCLPVILLIDLTVHEMGHVTVAWALHNRLRAINVGPFTFRDFGHGYHFHFDWKRMFAWSGFVSSASLTGDNLRTKMIAEVAGGPTAGLLGAVTMAAVFSLLPGTPLAALWWFPGYLFVMFVVDAVLNLVPVGYSDGSMLLHLILWTDAGKLLIGRAVVGQVREDAEVLQERADFGRRVELWRGALAQAEQGGAGNAMTVAYCHGMLGCALYSTDEWAAAETELRKCLEFEAECSTESGLRTTCWLLLEDSAYQRHQVALVGRAYSQALAAIESQAAMQDKMGKAVLTLFAAGAHLIACAFEKAAREAQSALRMMPPGREQLILRAHAGAIGGQAQLAMGDGEQGRASAFGTAELLRSAEVPEHHRNLGWDDLSDLALGMWRVGETALAVEWMRAGIEGMESGGALFAAAQHRVRLAGMLRVMGKLSDARKCLPEDAGLPDYCLRPLLAERARLHLAAAEPSQAAVVCERLLPLWQQEPLETALTESLLAEACLNAGDHQRASELAHKAAEVLGPWQHYEMATCLVTIALAQRLTDGQWLPEHVEKARQLIEADVLLRAMEKARLLDAQKTRLRRYAPAAAMKQIETSA